MAREISHGLINEIEAQPLPTPAATGVVDLLFQHLADEVVKQIDTSRQGDLAVEELGSRLQALETKVGSLLSTRDADDDEDEVNGTGSALPNLKYAKPKYKGVDSVLKYIEGDDDKGGVKLVIMNFND